MNDRSLNGIKLNWYAYGARFYDPALGRWHVQDPLSELEHNLSPYNYVGNNPINFVDPTGMVREPDPYFELLDPSLNDWLGYGYNGLAGGISYRYTVDFRGVHYYHNKLGWHAARGFNTKGWSFMNQEQLQAWKWEWAHRRAAKDAENGDVKWDWITTSGPGLVTRKIGIGIVIGEKVYNYYFNNFSSDIESPDWLTLTQGERILIVMNAMRQASINKEPYIDIRQIFSNYPKYASSMNYGEKTLITSVKIENTSMPVTMDIAIYEDMRISTAWVINQIPYEQDVYIGNFHKTGWWDRIGFYSYPLGSYNPYRLSFQVPSSYCDIFINFLSPQY